jgi:hypothetical protein
VTLALKQGPNGKLAVFTAADTLSIDDIDRLSGSGNMTIGASLGATEELQLASIAGLTRVLGDLVIDGQMDADLDMGGNSITNVNLVDGVDVSAHSARHVLGGADELDGDELDVDFTPSNYTPTTGTPGSNADHLAAHLRGIDTAIGSATGDVTGPGTHGDNIVPRFNGTDTNTLQTSTATIDDNGVLHIDLTGSTTGSPGGMSWDNFTTGTQAYRWGTAANDGIQSQYAGAVTMYAFNTLIFRGDRETTPPSFDANISGLSAAFINEQAASIGLAVRGASSQTAALQQWQNSAGTMLCEITAAGDLDLNGKHLDDIATAHYEQWASLTPTGGAIDVVFDAYQAATVTLNAANVTVELQTPRGPGAFKLLLLQDGTGGRNVTWATEGAESIYAPNGTLAPDTNANTYSLYGCIYNGANWFIVKSGSMQTV